MSAAPLRIGKARPNAKGTSRTWTVKLYAPTVSYNHYRVAFKDPETQKWVHRTPESGEDPEVLFARIEQAFDSLEQGGPLAILEPTLTDLWERYLAWLQTNRTDAYVTKVEGLVVGWVLKFDADLPVRLWGPEASNRWVGRMREAGRSPARVADLGSALSGLRNTAQRKTDDGTRWLAKDDDPLEGVSYSRRVTNEGAHCTWVAPNKRPITTHVESLITVAQTEARWDWMPTQLGIGVYCGPRLAEQMALRAFDIDLVKHKLNIRCAISWARPKKGVAIGLKQTKTGRARVVPYPASLHDQLVEMVRRSLGLDNEATIEEITAEQTRLYELEIDALDEPLLRTNKARPISPHEHLLFIDPQTGLPATKEKFGTEFRRLRALSTWPSNLPWLNARHHAVMWWRQISTSGGGAPAEWKQLASYLGNSYQTTINHYVRDGEDQHEAMEAILAQF